MSSAVFFGQVNTLWCQNEDSSNKSLKISFDKQQLIEALRRTLDNDSMDIEKSGGTSLYLVIDTKLIDRALTITSIFNVYEDLELIELLHQAIDNIVNSLDNDNADDLFSDSVDYVTLNKLALSVSTLKGIDRKVRIALLEKIQAIIFGSLEFVSDLNAITNLYDVYDKLLPWLGQNLYFSIRDAFEDYLSASFYDEVTECRYSNDLYEMSIELERLGLKLFINIDAKNRELLNEADEKAANEGEYDETRYEGWRDSIRVFHKEQEDIADMFDSLRR